jgi:hypothetical protein
MAVFEFLSQWMKQVSRCSFQPKTFHVNVYIVYLCKEIVESRGPEPVVIESIDCRKRSREIDTKLT